MEGILWVAEGREFQKEVLTSDKALRQEQACQSKDEQGGQNEANGWSRMRSEGTVLGWEVWEIMTNLQYE